MKETNREIFKTWVEEYTPLVFNFTARLAGRDNAPDLVQETFIKAWKSMKKFDPEKASLKTWILTIARNTAFDFLRKKKMLTFSDLENEEENNIPEESTMIEDVLQKAENSKNLNSALSKMPENYKSVILFHYEEEMTFDEIGKVMGKPLNTVKSWHRRALLQLKSVLS